MGSSFNLGKIFGIQFRLHYTWFIIFFLITVLLSWQVFPVFYPGWSQSLYWGIGISYLTKEKLSANRDDFCLH